MPSTSKHGIDFESVPESRQSSYFALDPAFARLIERLAGPEGYLWSLPMLEEMGSLAAKLISDLAVTADRHRPLLQHYNADGQRVDHIEYHPAYREMEALAYGFGLVSMSYDPNLREKHGRYLQTVKFALGYLFAQGESGLYCPICMTDGAARIIERHGDETARSKFLPRLTTREHEDLYQGAMFITEKQGGSDIGATATEARKEDGDWRIYGEKWFCSNVDAEVILTLARPAGARGGTAGLGLYVVPSTLDDGSRNDYRVNRLKNKLGVTSMPTGEVTFEGALAYEIEPPGRGMHAMLEMIALSRLYNAVASVGVARRAFLESCLWTAKRAAFGRPLHRAPLLRADLIRMAVRIEAANGLVFETARALDAADAAPGDAARAAWLRILTPLAKAHTARLSVETASDAIELHGGNGYIEDFVTPRLLRDAQVLPIWEGTTNILSLDTLRAMHRELAHELFIAEIRGRLESIDPSTSGPERDLILGRLGALERALPDFLRSEMDRQEAAARDLLEEMSRLAQAAFLLEQADWEAAEKKDGRKRLVAKRYIADELGASGAPDVLSRLSSKAEPDYFEEIVCCRPLPPTRGT